MLHYLSENIFARRNTDVINSGRIKGKFLHIFY